MPKKRTVVIALLGGCLILLAQNAVAVASRAFDGIEVDIEVRFDHAGHPSGFVASHHPVRSPVALAKELAEKFVRAHPELGQAPSVSVPLRVLFASDGSSVWYVPKPEYPTAAREHRIEGKSEFILSTNSAGRVRRIVMTKSTGSSLLDHLTINTMKQSWLGPPSVTRKWPVDYRLVH